MPIRIRQAVSVAYRLGLGSHVRQLHRFATHDRQLHRGDQRRRRRGIALQSTHNYSGTSPVTSRNAHAVATSQAEA
jgi:hypothetical protein